MLGRLRITQRLGLLLVLPLLAVLLTSVPLAVERVGDARSAAAIVDSAHNARTVAAVIADLQAERLLALAYLASSRVSHAALVTQIQTVRDLAAQAGPRLGSAAPLALLQALTRLVNLDDVRQAVLDRHATMTATQDAYHRAVVSLLDALRLPDQPLADAAGLRQMASLDAMLRAGEIANQVDAALVMGAVDPVAAGNLVAVSGPLEQVHLDRFRQQGDPAHVALLDLTAQGPSANRVREVAAAMTRPDGSSAPVSLDIGLAAAQAGIAIRTGVTDHVVNDIATRASGRATSATTSAALVGGSVLGLIVLVVWLGTVVSRSVSRPLRRVTAAATAVANLAARELVRVTDVESDDHRPPRLTAVRVRSADELGELASAFNRVQATAALMMEQQVTTRRNVAVMFANIARRTGGLVARQLSQIEELERDEPDQRRLARLYRLDHLTTRLRRSADSLLVVAGVRPDARIDAPMPLADVIRSAIGEVEGYRRVELGTVTNSVVTAAVVPDLILLLAELLENATAFSPPGTYVDISADVRGTGIVQIIDRGIGMLPQRLAEENLRLVTRERLDVAPTARLGLLVVGRLARRHGLNVRLRATVPTGVTVEVALPQNVFLRTPIHAAPSQRDGPAGAEGASRGDGPFRTAGPSPDDPLTQPDARSRTDSRTQAGGPSRTDDLSTTGSPSPTDAPARADAVAPPPPPPPPSPSSLPPGRETTGNPPGGHAHPAEAAPTGVGRPESPPYAGPPAGANGGQIAPLSRAGLRRRQPGRGLADLAVPQPGTGPAARDPAAERELFDSFVRGTARAAQEAATGPGTTDESRGGLRQRRRGEHLDESLRDEPPRPHRPRVGPTRSGPALEAGQPGPSSPVPGIGRDATGPGQRDAEAERAVYGGYLAGLARAKQASQAESDGQPHSDEQRSTP
jgi:signal transduction histidine kinase